MKGAEGDAATIHVLTKSTDGWSVETVQLGDRYWETWSGAIAQDTIAVADTDLHSEGNGTVRVFTWSGSAWNETAEIRSQWDTHMFGSSVDLDGDQLLVAADGSSPGPGGPGGVYLYTRRADEWTPEVVAEGREGFGFSSSIDNDTIITAAAHGDETASFWVFTRIPGGWVGTPIQLDTQDDWLYGAAIHKPFVAVSTFDGVWIGEVP
jgi:hypothetical protein